MTETGQHWSRSRSVDPILAVERVRKEFRSPRGAVAALRDVTFTLAEGEFACIVGPSGCGKSTLLSIVAGLERPNGGRVLFAGRQVTGPGAERAMVFQEPALFPWLSVRGNVEFALKLRGMGRGERREQAERLLELVGLLRFQGLHPHELSGGMKQRAQLARALAVGSRLLLMDEPFGALDAQTREDLYEEVQRIWAAGTSVLLVTHDVREAVVLADRVLVMTPAPGSIKREVPVPLPRPRRPDGHEVVDVAAEVREALRSEPVTASVSGGRHGR
ncbi:MAG TPA: ABC transporter ATP-binding protein [Dehalococcoidia bacterium]|nr:ABC transporter ATP-binding protein [Dehalococcoidia bacterium]